MCAAAIIAIALIGIACDDPADSYAPTPTSASIIIDADPPPRGQPVTDYFGADHPSRVQGYLRIKAILEETCGVRAASDWPLMDTMRSVDGNWLNAFEDQAARLVAACIVAGPTLGRSE